MKKRMLAYLAAIDLLLDKNEEDVDYEEEMRKHLIQIGFFMHERLIHLIVTVTFAILTVGCILYASVVPSLQAVALVVAFMVLLVPYIKHYYLLENGVQKMYEQYDEMQMRKSKRLKQNN